MSIKTNELQKFTSLSSTDTVLVDTSGGTGRAEFSSIGEQMKDTFLAGGVPYGKELNISWTDLVTKIQAGNFVGVHIGDYKTITLTTGETVIMEVAGIDQYYKCGDAVIGHHIDFISRDCLAGAKVFNDKTADNTDTNNGTAEEPNPWRASKLFQTMNDTTSGVITTLPTELQSLIIEKRALLESRYSASGVLDTGSSWAWNNMGKLWLPTEVEVFGSVHWSQPGYGSGGGGCNLQYPIFQGSALHIIKGDGNGGGRCSWWESSALASSSTHVCCVAHHGHAHSLVASHSAVRVPLCFRLG